MLVPYRQTHLIALALSVALLSACSTKSSLESVGAGGGDKVELAAAAQGDSAGESEGTAEEARIIHQQSTVAQKGTYIRALVNGEPITNYDIQRRANFRRLRRQSTGQEATLKELVDEKLKLQEARKRGTMASDGQVDQAFANFAKSNRTTPSKISADLNRIGVGADHFKQFIRAQISWSRTVGSKLQSETNARSQSDAIFQLRRAGEEKPQTTEYVLQQIIFVIPSDKRGSLMQARRNEATNFRQRFNGCDHSIELAKELRDVTVKNLGRLMAPELPPQWKEDIGETAAGTTTKPKETEKGVELIAVCSSRVTSDDRAAQVVSQANTFENLEEKGDETADAFLAELRKDATIVYR